MLLVCLVDEVEWVLGQVGNVKRFLARKTVLAPGD